MVNNLSEAIKNRTTYIAPAIVYRIHYDETSNKITHFASCDVETDNPKIILEDKELIEIFRAEGTDRYTITAGKIEHIPVVSKHSTQLKQIFNFDNLEKCSIMYITIKGHPDLLVQTSTNLNIQLFDMFRMTHKMNVYDFYVLRREYNE